MSYFDLLLYISDFNFGEDGQSSTCSDIDLALLSDCEPSDNSLSGISSLMSENDSFNNISSWATDSDREYTSDACVSETSQSGCKFDKNERIFHGCPHTQMSSCVTLMLLATKHAITNELFTDILHLVSSFLPKPNKFIKSVYSTKEFVKAHMPFKKPVMKYICKSCGAYMDENEACNQDACQQNNSKSLEFFELNLEQQIQELFKGMIFM